MVYIATTEVNVTNPKFFFTVIVKIFTMRIGLVKGVGGH